MQEETVKHKSTSLPIPTGSDSPLTDTLVDKPIGHRKVMAEARAALGPEPAVKDRTYFKGESTLVHKTLMAFWKQDGVSLKLKRPFPRMSGRNFAITTYRSTIRSSESS